MGKYLADTDPEFAWRLRSTLHRLDPGEPDPGPSPMERRRQAREAERAAERAAKRQKSLQAVKAQEEARAAQREARRQSAARKSAVNASEGAVPFSRFGYHVADSWKASVKSAVG